MKPIDYYLSLNYRTSVYRDDESDYIVEVDELPGCMADGSTPAEAFDNLHHAMRSWIESRLAAGLEVPEPRGTESYSGRILLRMPRFLHRRLAEQARAERVSLNQYVVSLLSQSSVGQMGGANNISGETTAIPSRGQVPNVLYMGHLGVGILTDRALEQVGNYFVGLLNARVGSGSIAGQIPTARRLLPQGDESACELLITRV